MSSASSGERPSASSVRWTRRTALPTSVRGTVPGGPTIDAVPRRRGAPTSGRRARGRARLRRRRLRRRRLRRHRHRHRHRQRYRRARRRRPSRAWARDRVEHDRVVRAELGRGEQDGFDLGGEDVDAPDHEHVVAPADEPGHAHGRPAAGAWFPIEAREIARPVAHERQGLLRERREDELTYLAVRRPVPHLCGSTDLHEEVVFVHVQAAQRRRRASSARDSRHSKATPGPITSQRP